MSYMLNLLNFMGLKQFFLSSLFVVLDVLAGLKENLEKQEKAAKENSAE